MVDLKLIEECRGGNLSNFRKLVELTSPYAFSLAFRMLGDEDLAKDVVQETMVTIGRIKTPNIWAWIVSGLFLVFVASGIILKNAGTLI